MTTTTGVVTAGKAASATQKSSVDQTMNNELKDSLWDRAAEKLSGGDKEEIKLIRLDKQTKPGDVLNAVDEKIQHCKDNQWKFERNGKTIKIRELFDKVITWVKKFEKIGDTAAQYDVSGHAALPWAGVKLLIGIVTNDNAIYGAMAEGVERVSNLITRYTIFEKIYMQETPTTEVNKLGDSLVSLYTVVLEFLCRAQRYYGHRTAARLLMSSGQTAGSMVDLYINKISKEEAKVYEWKDILDRQHNQQMLKRVDELQTILLQLGEPINRSAAQLKDLHDNLKETERRELFRWISEVPYKDHHQLIGKDFLPKSGQWLLQKETFIEWRNARSSSVFWLLGIPGSGKSRLAYSVIEHLCGKNSSTTSVPVAYFYCSRHTAEPQRADPNEVMRSILKQLSSSGPDLRIKEPVAKAYKKKKKEAERDASTLTTLNLDECVVLILDLLKANPAMIIIDALDECDPNEANLVVALQKIIQDSENVVKVFVSSRINKRSEDWAANSPRLYVSPEDNSKDIERFVNSQVVAAIEQKRVLNGRVPDTLKDHIIKTLIQKAEGMFQLVSLHIQALCEKKIKRSANVKDALSRLPPGLDESYRAIFEEILDPSDSNSAIAISAMKWLLCAQRPLKAEEFIAAVSINSEVDDTLEQEDLIDICCNMVAFDSVQQVFRFAHQSVREYLQGLEDYSGLKTHMYALETCVDTCLFLYTEPPVKPQSELIAECNDAFKSYAALYWPLHWQNVKTDQFTGRTGEKLRTFLFKDGVVAPSFSEWVSDASNFASLYPDEILVMLGEASSSPPTPLFLACCFGLACIIHELSTSENIDWSQPNESGWTGLHLAASRGHKTIVRLLLEKGVDVNAVTQNYGEHTALQWAAENGYEDVVKFLVEKGADVNARTWDGRTALDWAAAAGRTNIIRLLIEMGADVNSADDHGRTALHFAAREGYEAMVKLLVENGADVNVVTGDGNVAEGQTHTPLLWAAEYGHEAVVKLLVEKGADVNAVASDGKTALHWATAKGQDAMAKLLVEKGAVEMTWSPSGWSALHDAASSGDENEVRLLLEKGYDVNATTRNGREHTALQWAAENGHEAVVKLLAEKGADVNARTWDGRTALDWAAAAGRTNIIRLLIEMGADVNSADDHGRTALHFAARYGHEAVAKLLVEKGANINAITENRGDAEWRKHTPLLWAAEYGHEAVVKLLVEKGADVDAVTWDGRTALDWAAAEGHDAIVKLLAVKTAEAL